MVTCTVRELVRLLQEQDQDAPVIFASNYGDHHRTQQAHAIEGNVGPVTIRESAYSDSGFAVSDNDDEDDTETVYKPYILIG